MKILIVGGSGKIGAAIVAALSGRHQLTTAGRNSGDHRADLTDRASLERLFAATGKLDAVISAAGGAAWKPLEEMTDDDFEMSVHYKLLGQVTLARLAIPHLSDGGSITLTGGTFAREPPPSSTAVSLVNAGLEGFGIAAALDLPRGLRINIVSPPLVGDLRIDSGRVISMPPEDVAEAYLASVEGAETGKVIDARLFASANRL